MIALSDVLGRRVTAVDGTCDGRVVDLVARIGDAHPAIERIGIGRRHRVSNWVEWSDVLSFDLDNVRLAADASLSASPELPSLTPGEIRLVRDVLDTQILDQVGIRLVRVGDVVLTDVDSHGAVRIIGVEIGPAPVFRRLGFRRLSARFDKQLCDWSGIRLATSRGLAIQLAADDVALQPIEPGEVAAIVANLSTQEAVRVLEAAPEELAVEALRVAHPSVSARLIGSLPDTTVVETVTRMRPDDATSALRGLPAEEVERLLAQVGSARAEVLRRLLEHQPDTAGGLMTTTLQVVQENESLDELRDRLVGDPPPIGSRANIFVVDGGGRPVGMIEPMALITGTAPLRSVPAIPTTLPVDRVIDFFAMHDVAALPVVDDDGRLIGAIEEDDVLAELLAERLPSHRRFAHLWIPGRRRGWKKRL